MDPLGQPSPSKPRTNNVRLLPIAIVLYFALTLPFAATKLNGDEAHFVTLPYLMLGGDYSLSAVKDGQYARAFKIAAQSYYLTWHYYTRPSDANTDSAAMLSQYPVTHRASNDREKPFVYDADYFVTHRKSGKPALSFWMMMPSVAATYLAPRSLWYYQREYIYHPIFILVRFTFLLTGLLTLLLLYRIVKERFDERMAGRVALAFSVIPATAIWVPDIHQEVPMALFILLFSYYLWKGRLIWAAVWWGLAFGTKNQSIFALAPLVAEAIWTFFEAGTLRERFLRAKASLVAFGVVFVVGLAASAPFGHPWANLVEVFHTSAPGFGFEIHTGSTLYLWMPIWAGMGFLGFLGLRLLDDAKDQFDRYHVLYLILPAFFHFFVNSRLVMLIPSVAILIGCYFRTQTFYFLMAGMMMINLYGIQEPYLSSRGIGYRFALREMPHTIGDIEMVEGVGSIVAEEARLKRLRLRQAAQEQLKDKEKPPAAPKKDQPVKR